MSIPFEEQVNTVLSRVFGTEVYPIAHPAISGDSDSVTNMFCIWNIVGGQSINKLDGDDALARVRLQISVFSNDYTELKNAQRNVSSEMQTANTLASQCVDNQIDVFEVAGAIANIASGVPIEGREEDTRRFYFHVDYYCWSRG